MCSHPYPAAIPHTTLFTKQGKNNFHVLICMGGSTLHPTPLVCKYISEIKHHRVNKIYYLATNILTSLRLCCE